MKILNVLLALVLIASLAGVVYTSKQCHATGGTVVRGLVWLECVK
jgi:hypothetical protein